jgi:hypothetical protein
MKKKLWLVALAGALLLSAAPVPTNADFYVIAGGGRAGTQISSVPYTISLPGLYCLAGNLSYTPTTGPAITVNASDVTLDLMGFCLTGPGKAFANNHGINIQNGASNVEIRNGSINNFGSYGIVAGNCTGIRVLGIRVREVGFNAIHLQSGTDHVVAGCSVINAGAYGILVSSGGIIKGNHVTGSSGEGINAYSSTIADNLVQSNTGSGIFAHRCTITGNTAWNNTNVGINAGDYSTIANNTTDGLTYGAHCNLGVNTVD